MSRKQEALLKEMIQLYLADVDVVPTSRVRQMTFRINESRGLIREIRLSDSYITGVLGISRRTLLESADDSAFQRMVLREHLLYEGFWSKAKEFTVNAIKKNPISTTIDAVKTLGKSIEGVTVALTGATSAGESGLAAIVDGSRSMAEKGLAAIRKAFDKVTGRIKALAQKIKNDKIKSFIEKVTQKIFNVGKKATEKVSAMMSASGWKGMFSALAGWLSTAAFRTTVQEKTQLIMQVLSGNSKEMFEASKTLLGDLTEGDDDDEDAPEGDNEEENYVSKAMANLTTYFSRLFGAFFVKAAGALGVEAVASLAGPVAWINSAAKAFRLVAGGVSWVCDRITEAINRASGIKIKSPAAAST